MKLEVGYRLWETLFAPVNQDLVGVAHIWLQVPGVLEQIPFEALVTEPPAEPIWRQGIHTTPPAWLIRSYSIALLPSLGSFTRLSAMPPGAPSSR